MDLDNSENWRREDSGRSLAYFSTRSNCAVNFEIIEALKLASEKRGNVNARLCLHTNPSEDLQSMIIMEYQDKKCLRPHKHLNCDEVIIIIEGRLLFLMFDEAANLTDKVILEPGSNIIHKNHRGDYHLYLPVDDYAIYSETKNGPFKHEDCLFPKWDYRKALECIVDFMDLKCRNSACKHKCDFYGEFH